MYAAGLMPIIRSRCRVAASVDVVFAFFDDPANLPRLMPPPVRIRLVRIDPAPPQAGSLFEFEYRLGPFQRSWLIRLVGAGENEGFVDDTISDRCAASTTPTPSRRHVVAGPGSRTGSTITLGRTGRSGRRSTSRLASSMRLTFIWRQARQRRILTGR